MDDSSAKRSSVANSLNPSSQEENRNFNGMPQLDMEFERIEDGWEFWRTYGGLVGFDIRKAYYNKSKKDGRITSLRFVCNKEGCRREDKRDQLTKCPRAETRTNCPVRMGLVFNQETGRYKVHDLIIEHNHMLHLAETVHMMTSQRKISNIQTTEIDLADDSGIRLKASFEFISRQGEGKGSVGYTLQDQKNYLRTKRQRDLKHGEAGSILRYFQRQTLSNMSFYHAEQLDDDEQITNIFWADARMIMDYAYFGDVITFDTTYSTNKDFRPLGVFLGFNHHRAITIFGAVLLYDETSASFEWLFKTFLEAHKGKMPRSIFTDQDPAMASALSKVMPETYHGLCSWHIMQNATKHLGNLLKEGSHLLKDFNRCMYHYEEENEFQEAWEKMLISYEVQQNSWLHRICERKEQWARCYMKNAYTLGMRSTQLSESFNGDLKDHLKSDLDIIQFFKHFERVVEDKRYNELKTEYNSRQKLPRLKMRYSPLLKQMGHIYTPTVFELFQEEYDLSLAAVIKYRQESDQVCEFIVAMYEKGGEYRVIGDAHEKTVYCSCKKFDTFGILCSHALKVFDVMDIKLVPDIYILKRWTRGAKNVSVQDAIRKEVSADVKLEASRRYQYLCPKLIKLASRVSENEEAYELLNKVIQNTSQEIENICTSRVASDFNEIDANNNHLNSDGNFPEELLARNIRGLKKRIGKKCGKRPKSWVEKQPKITRKKKKTIPESQSLEIVEASNAMTVMSSSQVEGVPNTHTALLMAMSSTGPINRENPFNFGSSSQTSSYKNGINGEPTHFINIDESTQRIT